MASISFPSSPSNGDTYSYDGLTYQYNSTKNKWSVVATTTIDGVSADAIDQNLVPSANVTHDLGTADKAFRDLYLSGSSINLGDATISSSGSAVTLPAGSTVGGVTIGTGSGGATQYANTASLPKTDLTFGEFALVGNTLFITNGVGWYSVALINQSPSLSISVSDISLGSSGNTINFTYTASDPDGPEPTVTMTTTANTSQANVTLYTSNSTVTVENLSATDYSANITLTATDGIDQTFGTVTLTVGYYSELWEETVLSIGTSSTNSLDNSTFIDRSTNASTVTTSGSPIQTAFHPYLDNWSVDFDGNDYLTFADQSDWDFVNSGDFTVDSWIYPRSNSNISWFGQSGGGGGRSDKWGIYINDTSVGLSAGTIGWHLGNNGNIQGPSFTPTANTWYHIRLGREGDVWYFFVDGVLLGTTTSTIRPTPVAQTLRVGADGEAYRVFNGYLSNFRIVKGTNLSTTTFDAVTENLTSVTNTVLLTCQSNRVVDNSTNNYSATFVGDPKVSAFNPFGQGSEYAVGGNKGSFRLESGDWVQSPSTSQASLSYTQDWTIEFWAYMDNDMTSVAQMLFNSVEGTGNFYPYIGSNIRAGGQLQTQAIGGEHLTTGYVNPYEWFHVALVHDYSANELKTYLNGTLVQTLSKTYTFTTGAIRFNSYTINTASNYPTLGGYLSDFKWTIGSTVYTSNFTPPTAPVGNTNAGLYFPMDNVGIFDKTGNHTLTPVGNASTSTTQTKFADTAMYFDGSGDWIITTLSEFPTTFTVEMWLRFNSVPGSGVGLLDGQSSGLLNMYWDGGSYGTNVLTISNRSTNQAQFSWVPTAGQWYHLALVRESDNTMTAYVDGTSIGSVSNGTSYGAGTYSIGGDAGNNWSLNGYIENLQILKGIAKYTANFTPPTQEQGRTYQAES